MTLKIFKIDASPPVRAVLMTAEIINLNYESVEVDFMGGEHLTPEYREKNPLHSVPYIQDGDFVLADSHAIITYLVSKYGGEHQAKLYPDELSLRATINQRLFFDTSLLFTSIRGIVKSLTTEGAKTPSQQQIQDVNDAFDILDKYLRKTKFVAADHLTLADVSCVASVSTLAAVVPVNAKYTRVNAWWSSLKEEDWYKKGNLPGLTQLEGFINTMTK